jgi:glycolate oxidase
VVLPKPSRTKVDACLSELDRVLGSSKVDTSESARETCARDESEAEGVRPDAVVHVRSAQDVAMVLEVANRHDIPVTPRAGGTGRTGGAIPLAGGVVVATDSLNRVVEIDRDELVCVVEPGVVTGDLHAAVERESLFYPPDPNSWKTCMIGGNLAENAGGPRAFKYGVTRSYVLGLTAHTMGGQTLRVGRRTVKGVTGYDVTSLLVGSEGTLAIFSEVTLRLVRNPPHVITLVSLFASARAAAAAVQGLIGLGIVPRCIELMDGRTLDALRNQGVSVDPRAGAMVLLEVDGTEREAEESRDRVGEWLADATGVLEVLVAQSGVERSKLWEARRALSPATKKLARYKLSEDVVVPRSKMVRLLEEVDRIGERERVNHLTYGHAGDGNLHVNFLWNDPSEKPAIDRALFDLMKTTVELGGTLSGEHGIGLTKRQYLPLEQSAELLALQRNLKAVFDPKGLLNPGKVFAVGHQAC